MRKQGEGAFFRVPADRTLPLKYWQATLELPSTDGGRRRKFIRAKDQRDLVKKVEQAKKDFLVRGDLHTGDMTVTQWFTYWFTEVVVKNNRPKTVAGYKSVVFGHIIPTIGAVKLEKLTPAHVRKVTDAMLAGGAASTYALNAHRIMSRSLEIALREGRVGRNVAKLMDAPRKSRADQEAFEIDEAIRVLDYVQHDNILGVRWAVAMLTGARRGEVIGLERDRVTDDTLDLSWQLQRIVWAHGCGAPTGKREDTGRDLYPCNRKRGTDCPTRKLDVPLDYDHRHIDGGLYWTRPKSHAGWRIIPLVSPLRGWLEGHMATTPENPWGLVFTTPDKDGNPRPIDPDQDTARWKTVLAETGIEKDVVLHGLRHTAVDLLYAAGVDEDLIPMIVGHSTRAMSRSYKTQSKAQQARIRGALEQMSALVSSPE
jgi:integrase